jgi:copper transport protein
MSHAGRLRLAVAGAILAVLAAPALGGPAGQSVLAHAGIVASTPGAGTVVAESPSEIRLVFSEPLEAQATSLDVVAQDGTPLLERGGQIDPQDPYALVVDDPQLPDGVYSLTWRTLSAADGHTAEGFFTFGVGDVSVTDAAAGAGVTHSEADPFSTVARWLTYVGLLLAVGVAAFHGLVIRQGLMPIALKIGRAHV